MHFNTEKCVTLVMSIYIYLSVSELSSSPFFLTRPDLSSPQPNPNIRISRRISVRRKSAEKIYG